ncbi:hypothetical protein CN988_19105 [Bacillus thuringiensis]|uniref:DUF1634 domain-containing protein n=1 Tax=Bacillus thuringiensis TaxID=1428 RepID=UPI000BF29B09|nr:DUF1634 domain-containing protein [Bacillus thuringiensis]PFR99347.1 hypothetical protein COK60_31240 [Bacillus thuringiensis]PFS25473.1 hypothetical protein COK45_04770 [Bacillus thuringiensis]PGN49270.1 hypothetical protein CN961_31720 [Bacillus thuringiensis]PGO82856.1 hypothetical protein CN988_19105 [Bacillus thuringiensis]PGP34284.1 hypothetical protein COA06_32255 [Bacillus thuringiensis]
MLQEKGNKKESNIANVEILISKILRVGVLISGTCITIGLILFLVTGESGYPGDTYPTTLSAIWSGVLAGKAYAIILLSLFLLILTPVFRVGVSLITFWIEKDTLYVIITGIVFTILMISFALGKAG